MTIKYQAMVYLFFAAFFLMLSGGRIGSGDAGAQLQAATLLAVTGRLWTDRPPETVKLYWVKNAAGKYYQGHDIGNIALMYLPAKIAAVYLACSPKTDPGVMRVKRPEGAKETLNEKEASQSRADHSQAA